MLVVVTGPATRGGDGTDASRRPLTRSEREALRREIDRRAREKLKFESDVPQRFRDASDRLREVLREHGPQTRVEAARLAGVSEHAAEGALRLLMAAGAVLQRGPANRPRLYSLAKGDKGTGAA